LKHAVFCEQYGLIYSIGYSSGVDVLLCTEWFTGTFISEYGCFTLSLSFYQCSMFIFNVIPFLPRCTLSDIGEHWTDRYFYS